MKSYILIQKGKQMTKYTVEEIKQAIKSYYEEKSFRKAAKRVGIPKSTIHVWVQRIGIRCIDKRRGSKKPARKTRIAKQMMSMVQELFEDRATRSVLEVHQKVREKYGCSMSTTRRAMKKLGLSRKRVSKILNPNTPEQIKKIKDFRKTVKSIPLEDVISIDESSFDSRMLPHYGYSMKGLRIKNKVTLNSRDRQSLVCGVSTDSVENHYIVDGSMNKIEFMKFLQSTLPNCKQSVILLDNISFHKSKEVLKIISDHGKRVIFVPPYSPQYNPIEHVFSSMKCSFRKMREAETELVPLTTDRLDNFVHAWKACYQPVSWTKTFNRCLRKCLDEPLADGRMIGDGDDDDDRVKE